MDGSGSAFTPNVVRVGVNVHHSVKSMALDTLVSARLGTGDQVCSASGGGGGHQRGMVVAEYSCRGWWCAPDPTR